MAFHKRFTFDDPEDSYWNQSPKPTNVFDDGDSRQAAARLAMDSLFDTDSPARPSSAESTSTLKRGGAGDFVKREEVKEEEEDRHSEGASSSHSSVEPPTPTEQRPGIGIVLGEASPDPSPSRTTGPLGAPIPRITGRMSTASLISECSVSSLPSEANKLDLDYNRLRAEHRKLQTHLETVRNERFRPLAVGETVRRMLQGEPVSLDLYRSKEDKLSLLDAACAIVDDSVILAVLLFLKSTLSDALFRDLLLRRSQAADVYVEYLRQSRDVTEMATTLFALGRNADAAMMEMAAAYRVRSPTAKAAALKRCLASAFSDPLLAPETALVADAVNLLERQLIIEEADKKLATSHPVMKEMPPRAPLAGQSAIATLYYSSLYHYDLPPANPANPQSLSQLLRLNERQFVWTAVCALVRQSRWPDVQRALQTKGLVKAFHTRGILSGIGATTKLSCPFSWRNLFRVLHSNGGQPPKDLLARILRSVADDAERLHLAQKAKVSEIVIECLVAAREREKLAAYAATLTPNTPDAFKALAALNNTSVKWKS